MTRPRTRPHIQSRAPVSTFRLRGALGLLLLGAACTQLPALDATIPHNLRNAPYPDLVPLERVLATPALPRQQAGEIEQSLAARRDRLKARAAALNKTVIDPAARKRLQSSGDP